MASPVLKCQASPQFIAKVQEIEDRCNTWAEGLALAGFSHDTAVWGSLTQVVDLIEQQVAKFGHGSQQQREAMINLGRAGSLLLSTLRGTKLPMKEPLLRWTSELKQASNQAVLLAHNCETFISCFTMWHKNRYAVEVLSDTNLRFSVPVSVIDRRIQAYQQGRRVPSWPSTQDNPFEKAFVDHPDVNHLLLGLRDRVTLQGALAMSYPDNGELLRLLRSIHDARFRVDFRRNPLLDLGGYKLEDFRQFFAVLTSLCAVHEYLCDDWSKRSGRYPFESAVMVKPLSEWVHLIAGLCNAPERQVRLMIADLTFGTIKPLDIYIHPFVPSLDGKNLFLVPHFILNSRAEENILRVCSYARPDYYRPIANAKELEMREHIKNNAPPRYTVVGPLKLPDPKLPDIDILIRDDKSSAILIGELKWLRKVIRAIEHLTRDVELDEGFRQLRDIREFLEGNPDYLVKRGVVESGHQPNLSYTVIARDHMSYNVPQEGPWSAEFDAFIWALKKSGTLTEAIRQLQSLEWLPVEGRDFTVSFESSSVAGVTIHSETFHLPPDGKLSGVPV